MRTSTSWACAAVLSAAAGGTFTLADAGGQNPTPAPPPREKPTDAAWLPKPGSDPAAKALKREFLKDLATDPPSAFPDLDISEADWKEPATRAATFRKLCPRLFGAIVLKIEATDDTLRKLLKARLHQGTLEFQYLQSNPFSAAPLSFPEARGCLVAVLDAATELWAGQPKELVPWLEEFVTASKHWERYARVRVEAGGYPLSQLHSASRLRLKMEAELWKAKNPK